VVRNTWWSASADLKNERSDFFQKKERLRAYWEIKFRLKMPLF